ncbi:hypothetical protein [Aquidulcibacter sp.]|uniref:hypothetical protein n=1 Tax=Aquidulcibacter sp. TaxID=2052990 RepID=UPI0025C424E1|nr:hypothetical protein [Aquidulcibacter sp.]MCA3696675.1 hypothetical protein [Aquidulcibacter sp.]
MTRLAAVAVWLALGFALLSTQPQTLPSKEPVGVAAVRLEPLVRPPVVKSVPASVLAVPALNPPSAKDAKGGMAAAQANSPERKVFVPVRVGTSPASAGGRVPSTTPVGIASAPTAATGPSQASAGPALPSLTAQSQAIIKAQACAQIDIKDRPPDCPPNAELKRLLQIARGPKYRPENAEAFSRNELRWRDIPPPCLEDGQKVKMTGMGACVRFGNTPSRVRSPQEICEAKGLGGCAPVPSQAAVNAALKQAKGQ